VKQGADYWSVEHNDIMYGAGCPWNTVDGSNCSTSDYPSSGTGGIFALALQFMNSVETVLETYGGPSEAWEDTWDLSNTVDTLGKVLYETVVLDKERVKLLESDKAVRFVLDQVPFCISLDLHHKPLLFGERQYKSRT